MSERPLYVVAAFVPRRERVAVGALGDLELKRGWHAYVGGAARGREARVARHMRADKPRRWHADHLFTRHPATRAWLVDLPARGPTDVGAECELTGALADAGGSRPRLPQGAGGSPGDRAVTPRFGASDCRCPGHLLRFASLAELRVALPIAVSRCAARRTTTAGRSGSRIPTGV